MRIQVRLFGDVSDVAGRSELPVELADGGDVGALLAALDEATGRPVSASLLHDPQTIHPSVAILANGSNVLIREGLRTRLADGDRVAVMPLLGGGQPRSAHPHEQED